jgi:hypothetical protein
MSYADDMPETAAELVKTEESHCICRWEWIADPNDLAAAADFQRPPQTLTKITYSAACKYSNHGARGQRNEYRLLRFTGSGHVEDVRYTTRKCY